MPWNWTSYVTKQQAEILLRGHNLRGTSAPKKDEAVYIIHGDYSATMIGWTEKFGPYGARLYQVTTCPPVINMDKDVPHPVWADGRQAPFTWLLRCVDSSLADTDLYQGATYLIRAAWERKNGWMVGITTEEGSLGWYYTDRFMPEK